MPNGSLIIFSPAAWDKLYGMSTERFQNVGEFPQLWLDKLESPCPFNPGLKVRETHMAFALPLGLTLGELKELSSSRGMHPRIAPYESSPDPCFTKCPWDEDNSPFVTEHLQAGWRLMLIEGVPRSSERAFWAQHMMVAREGYRPSSAQEEIVKAFLHYKLTSVYPNAIFPVRTRTVVANWRLNVGGRQEQQPKGVLIGSRWGMDADPLLGVGASRNVNG